MKDVDTDKEAAARLEDTQASIREGIARARKMVAESKRLLDRLRYARLGPRTEKTIGTRPPLAPPLSRNS